MFQAVAASVADAEQQSSVSKCRCGANWQKRCFTQSLCFVKEQDCMADVFLFWCENHTADPNSCQERKEVVHLLKGGLYNAMPKLVIEYSKKPQQFKVPDGE